MIIMSHPKSDAVAKSVQKVADSAGNEILLGETGVRNHVEGTKKRRTRMGIVMKLTVVPTRQAIQYTRPAHNRKKVPGTENGNDCRGGMLRSI